MDNLTDEEIEQMKEISYFDRLQHFGLKRASLSGSSLTGQIQNLTIIEKRKHKIPSNLEMLEISIDENINKYKNILDKINKSVPVLITGAVILIVRVLTK